MNTSDTRAPGAPRKRVRWTLLILLWAWVIVVVMTLDLFFNVSGFDSVRPRSETYRAARYAAHKMVGEEYVDGDFPNPQVNALPPLPPSALGNRSPAAVRLASELAAVRELEEARAIDDLREVATSAGDPRVRIAAMRGLANQAGAEARDLLRDCVLDASELDGVRAKAAMFIGRTGEDSMGLLEEILHSQLSDEIRAGAVLAAGDLEVLVGCGGALAHGGGAGSDPRPGHSRRGVRGSGHRQAGGDRGIAGAGSRGHFPSARGARGRRERPGPDGSARGAGCGGGGVRGRVARGRTGGHDREVAPLPRERGEVA
jgi:hypothetical protein